MNNASRRGHLRAPGTLIVIALSFSLLLAVTIGHSADRGISRLRILVPPSTAALPFLLMAKEHALPGTELQVDLFANHAQALALLIRGEADLLYSGTSQGWENRLDGSSIVMIDTGVWGISSLVGRDPSLKGFADLRGKRLALPFPGLAAGFPEPCAARQGIDKSRQGPHHQLWPLCAERAETAGGPARRRRPAGAAGHPRREEERSHASCGLRAGVGRAHRRGPALSPGQPLCHRWLHRRPWSDALRPHRRLGCCQPGRFPPIPPARRGSSRRFLPRTLPSWRRQRGIPSWPFPLPRRTGHGSWPTTMRFPATFPRDRGRWMSGSSSPPEHDRALAAPPRPRTAAQVAQRGGCPSHPGRLGRCKPGNRGLLPSPAMAHRR